MDSKDSVKVIHFAPGRVRLKVAAAKNNPAYSGPVREAFLAVPGINSLEVNSLTGSVLIQYDSRSLLADEAISALTHAIQQQFPALDAYEVIRWLKSAHF